LIDLQSKYDVLVIRYGEVYLKSKPVRKTLENILESRLRWKLDQTPLVGKYKLVLRQNMFYLYGSLYPELIPYITNTFGVHSVSPAIECQPTIPSIRLAIKLLKKSLGAYHPASYRIEAKKDKRLAMSHYTMEYEASSFFPSWKVQLKNPAFTIHIDAKEHNCYIYTHTLSGPGGFPYGSQGKVVALISKGIDSPVAAWLMAKRGCKLLLLHLGEDPPIRYKEIVESWAGAKISLLTIPFTSFLHNLASKGTGSFQCIYCKKSMYITAETIAKKTFCFGIVSGENLGQVASQTLSNLYELTSTIEMPIYRPLLTYDKVEIIHLARKIGTYGVYIHPDCPYVPSQPATSISPKKRKELMRRISIHEETQKYLKKVLNE
jgi:thiamine biosynthesis protein ThiI